MQVQNNFGGNTARQNLKITPPIVTQRPLCNRTSEIYISPDSERKRLRVGIFSAGVSSRSPIQGSQCMAGLPFLEGKNLKTFYILL